MAEAEAAEARTVRRNQRRGALPPAELPDDPAVFAGRQAELAQLRDEVRRPGLGADGEAPRCRVLIVAGRRGSGRTALAVRFARTVAADYPDGQFFVRMTGPGGGPVPAERAAEVLLEALGEPRPPAPLPDPDTEEQDAEQRAASGPAALREALAGRQVLLVLDDVTQVEQVEALLPPSDGCLVVAVTSGPLTGLADARPVVIGGLGASAATAVLVAHAGDTRIVCDPVAARTLAETLACHPMALCLVGGWLRARPRASVTDVLRLLAAHPAERPRVPSHEPEAAGPGGRDTSEPEAGGLRGRDAPEPLRVVLAKRPGAAEPGVEPLLRAFDLVRDGLPAQAARLLRLLTLAPGGVADPRTASALLGCPVDAAEVHLATLAEQQLLRPVGARGRHELPGCLREPLAVLLVEDRPAETELARARLLERLTRLLTACCHQLAPAGGPAPDPLPGPLRFSGSAEAWQWLDTELPVLRAALDTAVADGALDGLAMRLATALVRALPLWAGGPEPVAADLYALHGTVLELALRGGLHRQQAAALVNLGDLHATAGQHRRALERYRSALGPARAADDHVAVCRILEAVAGAFRASGDLVRAADWYGRALGLRRRRGEQADEVRLLGRLAAAHTAQGRIGDALKDYRAAAALHRKLGDPAGAVGATLGAARVQELAGNPDQAVRTLRDALEEARGVAGPPGARLQTQVLLRTAEALERAGDAEGGRARREQAAALGLPQRRRSGEAATHPVVTE
ncbi:MULTISPECIES: tetratricopeptide repeat protein [Streptacidiphilus]|uniref:Tetratricopeptide repeat protein n=1 Tax=Streptacidiphilus cavernicola TaxID=3342716 RepID=A0ABV6UIN3_9ACTN|nr:tetratricopeptide repeat protein [Streptacidiphilus jeojiense]